MSYWNRCALNTQLQGLKQHCSVGRTGWLVGEKEMDLSLPWLPFNPRQRDWLAQGAEKWDTVPFPCRTLGVPC